MLIHCLILCKLSSSRQAAQPRNLLWSSLQFSDGTKHLTDISISGSRFSKAGYTCACIFLNFEDLDSEVYLGDTVIIVEEKVSRKLYIAKSAFNNRNICWGDEIKIDQNIYFNYFLCFLVL